MLAAAEQPTRESLLAGLEGGQSIAWARVAEVYGPSVKAWCRKSGLQLAEADDVSQEVLVAVITNFADYRRKYPCRSFRKWLWKVTYFKLKDAYRQRYRCELFDLQQAESMLSDQGLDPDEPPDTDQLLDETLQLAMEELRKSISKRNWEIFIRAIRGEGTPTIIAKDFDTTPDNVRQIHFRGLAKLRKILMPIEDSGDL